MQSLICQLCRLSLRSRSASASSCLWLLAASRRISVATSWAIFHTVTRQGHVPLKCIVELLWIQTRSFLVMQACRICCTSNSILLPLALDQPT